MKKITLLLLLLQLLVTVIAQEDRSSFEQRREQIHHQYNQRAGRTRQQYEDERRKAEEEYATFRQRANEKYAVFMQKAWEKMEVSPAEPRPAEPKPPIPLTPPSPDREPHAEPLLQAKVLSAPVVEPPLPAPPIPAPALSVPTVQFELYGTRCQVHAQFDALRFHLPTVDEQGASAIWKTLSDKKYDALLHDCLAQRDTLRLGDWGYLRLLQSVSEMMQGKGTNEAVLLQMYLFVQSGYKARLGKKDGHFVLMVPFQNKIYNYSFVTIDGLNYYVLSDTKQGSVVVCNVEFPKEQVPTIALSELPILIGQPQPRRTFVAERFGTMKAVVGVDKSLIDFMNDYPQTNAWDNYAIVGLSVRVKDDLYPMLRSQLVGKSKKKAAVMLLDFVQTAFGYATDQEQFGYERPLFGDESFYYPKNDCEDRSILYSILVRDLLGLDVALVQWPGHMATAIAFPDEIDGDYFTIDGRRYTICDPTYVGAGIGESMPQFKGVSANLLKL